MDPTILIALQAVITITRALMMGNPPTGEQQKALHDAEEVIKARLDADLAKIANSDNSGAD